MYGINQNDENIYTIELDVNQDYTYASTCFADTTNTIMWQLSPQIFPATATVSIKISTTYPPMDVPTSFDLYIDQLFTSTF